MNVIQTETSNGTTSTESVVRRLFPSVWNNQVGVQSDLNHQVMNFHVCWGLLNRAILHSCVRWRLVCSRHKGASVCGPDGHTCTIPGPCCCLGLSWLASRSQGSPDWLLAERVSPPPASSSCWRPWQPSWVCCWRWRGRPPTRRRCWPAAFRSSWPLHLSYWLRHSMLLVCLEVFCFWGMGHLPATKVTHQELLILVTPTRCFLKQTDC